MIDDAERLDQGGVSVAFIAPKGAGKSSILNGLLRTWAGTVGQLEPGESGGDHLQRVAVLPLGAGGTTPCEVHFQHAERWSVAVEREEEAEIVLRVSALAGWAIQKVADTSPPTTEPMLEKDIRRCLTGVCGLNDAELEKLARTFVAEPEGKDRLHAELVKRIDYTRRVGFEAVPKGKQNPMEWLKDILEQLTWGRWPSQPFPNRIVVRGPNIPRIQKGAQPLRLVDSLGLPAVLNADQSPLKGRKDLEILIQDPWAVVVFVSGFTNPPEPMTASIKYAFSVKAELLPPHRALLPALYKGEPVPFDAGSQETRQAQRAREAADKQDTATANLSLLLSNAGSAEIWTRDQCPVVDLFGDFGPIHSIENFDAALDARMEKMAEEWNIRTIKEIDEAQSLLKAPPEVQVTTTIPTERPWTGWEDKRAGGGGLWTGFKLDVNVTVPPYTTWAHAGRGKHEGQAYTKEDGDAQTLIDNLLQFLAKPQ
jgi:hypothetical protein